MIKSMLHKCKCYKRGHVTQVFCTRLCSVSISEANGQDINKCFNKKLKTFDEIPGPKNYPVIGTLYKYFPFVGDYKEDELDKVSWLNYRRYGPLARENPGVRLLHLYDPDDIEAVFRQDDKLPARRSHIALRSYRISKPDAYNTGGLLATNGPDWWRLRSKFQKNFTSPQSVKGHISSTDAVVNRFVEWIKKEQVSSNDDLLPYLNRLNLEIIGKVAFNEDFNSFSPEEQQADSRSSRVIEAAFGSNSGIMKLDKGILWRFFKTPLYRRLTASQDRLEKISKEILYNKVNFYKSNNDEDLSILTSFLKQPNIDFKDIIGMMVDILMAAIDTTAYSTCFLLYHLGRNPDCQQKLYLEALSLLPKNDSEVTSDVISKAVFTRCCVKESLRLNPVSIGVGRILQKDMVLKGYLIPNGTVVVTQNMVASRLPQNIKDSLVFKPERWMRGSPHHESVHPFLSLPFGFGPRSCIARRLAEQNIQILTLKMIREFQMTWKGGDLGVITHLINKPDQPITLSFEPRSV